MPLSAAQKKRLQIHPAGLLILLLAFASWIIALGCELFAGQWKRFATRTLTRGRPAARAAPRRTASRASSRRPRACGEGGRAPLEPARAALLFDVGVVLRRAVRCRPARPGPARRPRRAAAHATAGVRSRLGAAWICAHGCARCRPRPAGPSAGVIGRAACGARAARCATAPAGCDRSVSRAHAGSSSSRLQAGHGEPQLRAAVPVGVVVALVRGLPPRRAVCVHLL